MHLQLQMEGCVAGLNNQNQDKAGLIAVDIKVWRHQEKL